MSKQRDFDGFDSLFNYSDYMNRKKREKASQSFILKIIVLIITSAVLLLTLNSKSDLESLYTKSGRYPFSMMTFNVGNGNCVLVSCEGKNILADCGRELVQFDILEALDCLGVEKLDLVILTHPDKDHIGSMSEVAENVRIDRFLTCENGDYEITEYYGELLSVLGERGIEVEYAHADDMIELGELSVEVISPSKVYNSSNENSVAVKLSYGNFSALLMGDAGQKAESDIVRSGKDISADVLLVGHHGSAGSSSEEFLNAVKPGYALLSVSENDTLPSDKALKRILDCGCEILRTDRSGNILVVYDDRNGVSVFTDR